jgi:hypothetical protein
VDPAHAFLGAAYSTVVAGIVIVFVAHGSGLLDKPAPPCICKHKRKQHVSAMDWDSNYGDPQHVGPNYRAPGTCRACACRAYIAA